MREIKENNETKKEDIPEEYWTILLWGLIYDVPINEWDEFAHDIVYKNRFNSSHKVVDVVKKFADKSERIINAGTKLYRARIYYQDPLREFMSDVFRGQETKKNKRVFDNASPIDNFYNMQLAAVVMAIEKGNSEDNAIVGSLKKWGRKRFKGYNSDGSGKAPANNTPSGRINPESISYLYLAEDPKTSVYEVRPTIGQHVSVALFKTTEELRIYDLAEDIKTQDNNNKDEDISLFEVIQRRFSEPNSGNNLKYLPTQYLGEMIKQMGFDGIRYKSSLKQDGINLVLFNDNKCKAIRSDIIRVGGINLEFENPDIYELEKHVNSFANRS